MAATRIPGETPVKPPAAASNASTMQSQIAASLAANPNAAGANGSYFAPSATAGVAQAQVAPDPYDISGDPILAKIKAITATARTNAQASALAQKNQLAVALGDADGITTDGAYADAARQNPYSTLAELKHGYDDTVHQHDESLNKQNLFYSGARAKTLADDAQAYQGQQYSARQAALGQVGSIDSALAQALSGADQQDITGIQDAGARASQRAATYGYDPGAYTDTAHSNMGTATTTPTTSTGAGLGLTTPTGAGSSVARALTSARPKAPVVKNAYLTSATKRG